MLRFREEGVACFADAPIEVGSSIFWRLRVVDEVIAFESLPWIPFGFRPTSCEAFAPSLVERFRLRSGCAVCFSEEAGLEEGFGFSDLSFSCNFFQLLERFSSAIGAMISVVIGTSYTWRCEVGFSIRRSKVWFAGQLFRRTFTPRFSGRRALENVRWSVRNRMLSAAST